MGSPPVRRRSGFTLIELLVVIAIIAILIGLLVPAVQKVREAAARSQCQNNLKQIGLALHNYHGVFKKFPAGWVGNGAAPNLSYGWPTLTLPYLEQNTLYSRISPDTRALGTVFKADLAALQFPVATFICPSDPEGTQGELNDNRPFTKAVPGQTVYIAKSNYAGNAGDYTGNLGCGTGIFYQDSKVRIVDIGDGTSNTFLVGERDSGDILNGTVRGRYAALIAGMSTQGGENGNVSSNALVAWTYYQPMTGVNGTLTTPANCFGSAHTGGINFVLCDGSVRLIASTVPWGDTSGSATAAPQAFNMLGGARDGRVISGDF
jgi:prepilin-type N-terminal cleavage/methylation domain-containing protein/prepilin-type processing-associated H-X9-DG protein